VKGRLQTAQSFVGKSDLRIVLGIEECSFLKKRTKKLLRPGPGPTPNAHAKGQKFFASFFQKRRPAFMLPLTLTHHPHPETAPIPPGCAYNSHAPPPR
jgi:hypothetical protein